MATTQQREINIIQQHLCDCLLLSFSAIPFDNSEHSCSTEALLVRQCDVISVEFTLHCTWTQMCMISQLVQCTKKLGMQNELHRNNAYNSVELLLLVLMLFLLVIPRCLLFFQENFNDTSNICFCFFHYLSGQSEGATLAMFRSPLLIGPH